MSQSNEWAAPQPSTEQGQPTASDPTLSSLSPGLESETARFTKSQRQLLEFLHANMGKVIPRERIWTQLYAHKPESDWPESEIIKVLICHLRKKLRHHKITTHFGFGYQMDPV